MRLGHRCFNLLVLNYLLNIIPNDFQQPYDVEYQIESLQVIGKGFWGCEGSTKFMTKLVI